MERDLIYAILGEAFDVGSSWSLERPIEKMDRCGDGTFKSSYRQKIALPYMNGFIITIRTERKILFQKII